MRKLFSVHTLLWSSLLLALAGSLRHVAYTFTSIDANVVWGWVQALAVDAGLFALALAIQKRRRERRRTRLLWLGVTLFSAISVYANLAYGLTHTLDAMPGWVVSTRAYVLAATLPILVLYLAEIVGDDVNHAVRLAERERRKAERNAERLTEKMSSTTGVNATREQAEHARKVKAERDAATKAERLDRLVDILSVNPRIGPTALSELLNVSRTTVYKDLDTLIAGGRISKNGDGVVVHR